MISAEEEVDDIALAYNCGWHRGAYTLAFYVNVSIIAAAPSHQGCPVTVYYCQVVASTITSLADSVEGNVE